MPSVKPKTKPLKQCKAHKGPLPCIYCEDIVAEAIKYATKPVAHYTSTWTVTENTDIPCICCNRPATHILAKLVKGEGVSVIDKANHHLFARCARCLPADLRLVKFFLVLGFANLAAVIIFSLL